MPLYEYECKICGTVNTFLQQINYKPSWFEKTFKPLRCKKCSSKELQKIISSFAVHKTQTYAEMVDDISKIAPVKFVPQAPKPQGPPPGGCPYMQQEEPKQEEKKRDKIILD